MTEARQDFDTAVTLLADMLEEKLDGEVDFADDFQPWTYLRETMPPLADRMEEEAQMPSDGEWVRLSEVEEEFLRRDPNNSSRMRSYFG